MYATPAILTEQEGARRYVFGMARRVVLAQRRGRQRHNALADRLRSVTREAIAAASVADLELRDALSTLPSADREIVLLVAWDGFSVADAGRIVGLKPDAARARYSRARARLRDTLASDE